MKLGEKIDRVFFSLSPSFYAIVSGAFIGIGTNLLTSLLFDQGSEFSVLFVSLAIASFLLSAGLCIYLNLVLEKLHSKATNLEDLITRVHDSRGTLWPPLFIGFCSVLAAIVLMYFAA